MDLFEQLEAHAASRPNDAALRTISASGTDSVTFRELIDRARAVSAVLRQAKLEAGDHVSLLMPNDHQFGVALLAAASVGAVAVPLDPSYDAARLCSIISHAECRVLICPEDGATFTQACSLREHLPELTILHPSGAEKVADLPPWPLAARDPKQDFLLMYTGGTTGAAKGVRLSMDAILITIQDTLARFPLSAEDHILSILPLFHIMAIQANLLGPLYAGSQVSYLQSRDPQAIVEAFRRYGITAFLCVPLFYSQLHRRIFGEVARQSALKKAIFGALLRTSRFFRNSLGWNAGRILFRPVHARFGARLRGFGVGGARFSPEIAADLHDLGFAFFQGYGMTETSGLAAISPMTLQGGLSSGPGLNNVEIKIEQADEQGHGEILLRGANIMSGYWKDEEATNAALSGGWLRTGDIGHLSGGKLHVIARKKEVIVLSSGKNIFPEPLETLFQARCPLIQEICIFGLHREGMERLHALIVPDSAKLRELEIVNVREELRYHVENLNRDLPAHEKLNGFDIRFEPLPRTSARKLQRFRIEQEFSLEETTHAPSAAPVEEPRSLAMIREMIGHIKPNRPVDPEMNLELDLAFDSLERVELLTNVQEAFALEISPAQAAEIFTVGDVMALVKNLDPARAEWAEWKDILREPLSPAEQSMAGRYLGARPIAAPLFFGATRVFCLLSKALLRLQVRLPKKWPEGPLILCANHQSYLDFPLIAGSLPYRIFKRGFSLSTTRLLSGGFQSWFGAAARSVPIDPDRNLRSSLRIAVEGLSRDMVLCVFPEGHRSMDGTIQPFRKGAAIVAVESGVTAIPIGVSGTGRVWGRASKRIRLAPVRVEFGAPLRPEPSEDYEAFNERLRRAIQKLVQ
jgi:long-chain acyl-CoA synthetase